GIPGTSPGMTDWEVIEPPGSCCDERRVVPAPARRRRQHLAGLYTARFRAAVGKGRAARGGVPALFGAGLSVSPAFRPRLGAGDLQIGESGRDAPGAIPRRRDARN